MTPRRRTPPAASRRLVRAAFVVSVVAGATITAPPAFGCSCAPPEFPRSLHEADGAFVGTWLDRRVVLGGHAAVTFEVERVIKGEFGPRAVVRTNEQGSACGLELLGAARTGLLLERASDGVWTSGLCSMVSPAELLATDAGSMPDPAIAPISVGWSVASIAMLVIVGVVVALAGVAFGARGWNRRGASTGDVP